MTLSKSKLFALGALVLLLGLGVLALRLDDDDTSDARTSDPALLRADAPVELQGQGRPLVGADPIETPSDPAAPAPVGRTVTGRVLDPAGNPVAGAEVFALPVLSEGLDEQRLKEARFGRVRTDESGTFRTELGEMRRPVLAAYFEGFLPARARLPDAGEPVVLKLGPPRRLRVRVLDAQGRWPADTTVFAQTDANETFDRALDARRQSASAEHEQQVEGDEEVTLSIASLAPLEVDCRPPFGFAAVPAKVTIGPDVEAVTFRLVRSARIHIRAHPAPGSNAFPDRMRLSAYVYRHGTQEVVQSASRLSTKIDFVRSIGPGRYRIEVAAPHRATWIHEIEIERAGQEVELDVPLDLPVPGTELAQVRLRPRDVGTVPDDVRTLAAKVDSNERYVDWIVLTRQAGGDWEECFSTGTDDGEIELEGIEAGRLASGLPAGTYDFVVAQRGTGRAGVVEGIRVVSGQTHAIDVALEPGTFVQLPRVVSPDSAYTSIRFSTTKTGVLPAYAFPTRWSTVVYDWPKAMEHLTRVPLTPTVFGPFPGAHVTVTTQPTGVSVSVEGASRRRK